MTGGWAILRAVAAGVALAGPVAAELAVPAELPPKTYGGQQYVDSKGCLFMRAGPKGNETWIPRVTRDGAPLCGNPPSGLRVPVLEKGAETLFTPQDPVASP